MHTSVTRRPKATREGCRRPPGFDPRPHGKLLAKFRRRRYTRDVDPFDSVTPIGKRETMTPAKISGAEQHLRDERKSNHDTLEGAGREGQLDSGTNRVSVRRLGSKRGGPTTRGGVLTLEQLRRMNSELALLSYRDAKATTKLSDRKHASTSVAIHTDKLLLLSNRPTQIHGFVEAEAMREPLRELGLVIAGARRSA